MAKRRKKSHGRRRRISGIAMTANSPLVKFGGMGAGWFLSDKIDEQITKIAPDMDPKIINGIMAAGGLYFLFMSKGKKSTLVTLLAAIAAGKGAKGLATDLGIVSGFRDLPVIGGYQQVPTIGNGYAIPSGMINGVGSYNVPKSTVMGSVPGFDAASGSGVNPTDK